ncbi:MAG: tryptophan-rich sensory protein [Gemmatimonadetes bacterium]|nr:tryptophan-rich sensory protein [Gemmatimonadota bacterium]
MSRTREVAGLVVWIGLCLGAGFLGSQLGEPGQWYAQLEKPSWNPPSWVFGPVWTVLYVLMGIAAWLVWKERGFGGAPTALGLFLAQLVLNVAWTGIFFGLQRPDLAFLEILVLWALILATLVAFWRVRAAAGALLLPYLAWVSFATALNFAIWQLNT